jgi:hypothetical protein
METNILTNQGSLQEVVLEFILAPMRYPEILPTVLPIIVGAVVIELYFGKHTNEDLGWNTSVGNAIVWVTTGSVMYLTTDLGTQEKYVTFGLIALGIGLSYLNFFHKWSSTVAFLASSSGIVYTLTYIFVVFVKTDMQLNNTVLKGAGIFLIGVIAAFKIIKMFETPADDGLGSFQ